MTSSSCAAAGCLYLWAVITFCLKSTPASVCSTTCKSGALLIKLQALSRYCLCIKVFGRLQEPELCCQSSLKLCLQWVRMTHCCGLSSYSKDWSYCSPASFRKGTFVQFQKKTCAVQPAMFTSLAVRQLYYCSSCLIAVSPQCAVQLSTVGP